MCRPFDKSRKWWLWLPLCLSLNRLPFASCDLSYLGYILGPSTTKMSMSGSALYRPPCVKPWNVMMSGIQLWLVILEAKLSLQMKPSPVCWLTFQSFLFVAAFAHHSWQYSQKHTTWEMCLALLPFSPCSKPAVLPAFSQACCFPYQPENRASTCRKPDKTFIHSFIPSPPSPPPQHTCFFFFQYLLWNQCCAR